MKVKENRIYHRSPFSELALQEKAINVICCGELVFEVVNATIELYKWQHICVSLDLSARTLRVLYDNVVGVAARPSSAALLSCQFLCRTRPLLDQHRKSFIRCFVN